MTEVKARNFIYMKESTNRLDAVNPTSGACGIGQAYPCEKLSSVCPDWKTNYQCQDAFFTSYAKNRYGSWLNAYNFWVNNNYY